MRRHRHVKSSLLKDSALWFIYEPKFLEWLESPEHNIFLCYGPQGVGKSVIT
jgi:SpoVK/Ycf46/Vps4 family AAA+-type ATPase